MTGRRKTHKPILDPASIRGLLPGHPAMTENRTIFPSSVVEVTRDRPDRILVSGHNNRKLGNVVAKGRLAGYALYGLTLEERATCPASCSVRDVCYGNGMHLARRHRIGDPAVFAERLRSEVRDLLRRHPGGVLVRLHVLGDFPSEGYVALWRSLLDEHPRLACYGYTHRLPSAQGGCAIGDAVAGAKEAHPDRFRIRWSADVPVADGAVVTSEMPAGSRTAQGIVCPAQTDATACCASCGLCWEPAARKDTIVFIRHGRSSPVHAAAVAMGLVEKARDGAPDGMRRISPIQMPANMRPGPVAGKPPRFVTLDPRTLLIEERYQRDLSSASVTLIRKIVTGWDWRKFKPPICVETPEGHVLIDGQHTAIGAATHPGIEAIPVMVIEAGDVAARAASFVAHNRDRIVMSELAILVGEVAAGVPRAIAVHDAILAGGGTIPRVMPQKGRARAGDVVSVGAARRVFATGGSGHLERIVRIAVLAGTRPIDSTVVEGLNFFLREGRQALVPDATIAAALRDLASGGDLADKALRHAAETGRSNRYRGLADLIASALPREAVAALAPPAVRRALPAVGTVDRASPRSGSRGASASARPERASSPTAMGRRKAGPLCGERYDWTPERRAALWRMAQEKRTRREMMEALGPGLTSNAIIGMLYRLRRAAKA